VVAVGTRVDDFAVVPPIDICGQSPKAVEGKGGLVPARGLVLRNGVVEFDCLVDFPAEGSHRGRGGSLRPRSGLEAVRDLLDPLRCGRAVADEPPYDVIGVERDVVTVLGEAEGLWRGFPGDGEQVRVVERQQELPVLSGVTSPTHGSDTRDARELLARDHDADAGASTGYSRTIGRGAVDCCCG